jgi:hypothetical protein
MTREKRTYNIESKTRKPKKDRYTFSTLKQTYIIIHIRE